MIDVPTVYFVKSNSLRINFKIENFAHICKIDISEQKPRVVQPAVSAFPTLLLSISIIPPPTKTQRDTTPPNSPAF
jgi:hypothetical protein